MGQKMTPERARELRDMQLGLAGGSGGMSAAFVCIGINYELGQHGMTHADLDELAKQK